MNDIQKDKVYKNRKTISNRLRDILVQTNFYHIGKTGNIERVQDLDKSVLSAAQLKKNGRRRKL